MAKNSMLNVHGYSPHQLVFGQNPNLTSVLMDKPPALEGTTVSARVAEHISALHASRKAFTEAECSERIRRALCKQLKPTDDKYEAGDKVYYKRVDCTEWKGPGVVIGQDGTVVFVRHGGTLVRVHQSRLSKVDAQSGDKQIPHSTTDDDTDNKDTVENDDTDTPDGEQSISEEEHITIDRETNTTENMSVTQTANEPSTPIDPFSSANVKLRAGQLITFTNRNNGVQHTARVLGRAEKAKETGVFPSFFKHAIVEPRLKKPNLDPTLLQNLRPISKLPFMSKLLEKAVAVHLTAYLEKYNIHDRFQSGFRKLHSTETALLKVTNDIVMSADSGEYTVLVLLDLTSAFDTVNHTILINRLRDLVGMSGSVLDWFSSYISERSFSVSANQIMSVSTELLCGVPQGSVLGPILFLIYILPLSQIIQQFPEVSYHLFADDIQPYYSFKPAEAHKLSNLIDCLTNIKQWLNNNCLQLNPAKTETLIIASGSAIPDIKRRLGDLGSSQKHNLRNLGVIFDEAFSLEGHLNQTVRTCFFHLRNISKLRSIVSTSELDTIIHAFISTRLDYCNSLFTCLNMKGLARLQVVPNSAARLLTRSNKGAHMTPVLKSLHWLLL
uniref:Reverse transcriptase domain-containing protein n=1 Tax=Oreochromis niloticus TaxID=8128 RepID=A0A669CZI7_ORENI